MGTLLAQPGSFVGSLDPRLGLVALKIKWAAASLDEAINGPIPDFGGFAMLVENQPRTFERDPSGSDNRWYVTSTVEGHQTPTAADGEEFEIQGTTSEDKIETHERYDVLLEVFGGTEDGQTGKAKWPKTLGETGELNPMHGVEAYLVPGLVWTRKWTAQKLDLGYIRRLGTIDNPPGNPPELDGNRNWLLVRITGTWRGNIWQFSASWMLSGPRGFVKEMYPAR